MRVRARGRHVKPSLLRNISVTACLSTAVAVPLTMLTAASAAAHPVAPSRVSAPAPAAPAPASTPTLRSGSRGAAVTDLQQRLGGLTADGVFGSRTRQAVVGFQSARGLAADGVVGSRTWAALTGGAPAAPARASRSRSRSAPTVSASAAAPVGSWVGAAVASEASRHAGKPYRYGSTGPSSFDCSGFVRYVFGQVGVSVPRTSGQQAAAARSVPRSSKQLGDLIVFRSGGRVSHVGIYAGEGTMWVARRTGTTVTRQSIYTGNYSVGRFA